MISLQMLSVRQPAAWRTPLRDPRSPASPQDKSPGFGLPSLSEMRDSQKAMRKELAAKKVEAVIQRRDALMLMVNIDPKAALKMTMDLAKALKEAVKDFVDAGGKNPTRGELMMMRRDANDAAAPDVARLRPLRRLRRRLADPLVGRQERRRVLGEQKREDGGKDHYAGDLAAASPSGKISPWPRRRTGRSSSSPWPRPRPDR